jgi:hypothetical protein
VQDLSRLSANSPWVTSQEAGNLVHDNSPAMTAPGTEPATPMPAAEHMADPSVTPIGHARTTLVPSGPRGGAPSPVPWTDAAGAPWVQSADDEYLPRTQLARGQWNEL